MNADELSQSKPDSERDESTLLLDDQSLTREEGDSMSPLDLFIRDLDEKRGKIPCCQEVTFSSPEPIASFSRRRLGTRHEGLWRHTKFEFFHWLVANNEILKRK